MYASLLREAAKRREKYKDAKMPAPTVELRRITMSGQLLLAFSNPMYVPEDFSQKNGVGRDSRLLQPSDLLDNVLELKIIS